MIPLEPPTRIFPLTEVMHAGFIGNSEIFIRLRLMQSKPSSYLSYVAMINISFGSIHATEHNDH